MLNRYPDISLGGQKALDEGKPVVALESTIISHGMPYPPECGDRYERGELIRENGAVPATIAIIKGRLKAGLTADEIDYLGKAGHAVTKASRRDLPVLVAKGMRRRLHRDHHHDDRRHGRDPGLCHRRHRRRTSGRGDHHGYLCRSGGAGLKPPCWWFAPVPRPFGPGPDPGVPRDQGRACHRLRHQRTARLLHPQVRLRCGL